MIFHQKNTYHKYFLFRGDIYTNYNSLLDDVQANLREDFNSEDLQQNHRTKLLKNNTEYPTKINCNSLSCHELFEYKAILSESSVKRHTEHFTNQDTNPFLSHGTIDAYLVPKDIGLDANNLTDYILKSLCISSLYIPFIETTFSNLNSFIVPLDEYAHSKYDEEEITKDNIVFAFPIFTPYILPKVISINQEPYITEHSYLNTVYELKTYIYTAQILDYYWIPETKKDLHIKNMNVHLLEKLFPNIHKTRTLHLKYNTTLPDKINIEEILSEISLQKQKPQP